MFLYPALTIGFLFVGVPLLVHLINMLRHRRQRWAAMDFLLASYRKQKKWIRLRQLLLLLSRLAVAALLIALLCGWTGGSQVLSVFGGQTTHHVVILDDSYSMADESLGGVAVRVQGSDGEDSGAGLTAYSRSLRALRDLTERLASSDGNHQLTVMRASRAAMAVRGGSDSGDAAADLSAQTITSDTRLIGRVMSTTASPVRTDLVPALDLATELVNTTPADSKFLYIASDFRERDWGSAERIAQSLQSLSDDVSIRMIDCAAQPAANLAITDLSPAPDVWVAGVPVVVSVTVKNYSDTEAKNVAISSRVIRYGRDLQIADPTLAVSGTPDAMPALMIESLAGGAEITKTFQVFVSEQGTHAIEVALPDDALPIDNRAVCTLPLSDVEKVLVIDGDTDQRGAYHVGSVLNPGSQVRIGAIPDIQPPSFLRSATLETLTPYRAVYLIDVPEIGENAADALHEYVRRGGGVAWFLGDGVQSDRYNATLLAQDRYLIPGPLSEATELPPPSEDSSIDIKFGDASGLLGPLESSGDGVFTLVGVSRSWELEPKPLGEEDDPSQPRVRTVLQRRDGKPLVTLHEIDRGRVITVLSGLDGRWTNWPGDPTFVVFLLQSNATLWSGAAPPTRRFIDESMQRVFPVDQYIGQVTYLPATSEPPRIPIEMEAEQVEPQVSGDAAVYQATIDPTELVISGQENLDAVLQPGLSEWTLTRSDGSGEVIPVASVIRPGEGDLRRADPGAIAQQLNPLEIRFISSSMWSEENRAAGSSTLTLFLLGLLGLILAAEQALAYWASYHAASGGAKAIGSVSGSGGGAA
ncbi:MAG: BatA domain-containing protein [Planctomycetota bacterium]